MSRRVNVDRMRRYVMRTRPRPVGSDPFGGIASEEALEGARRLSEWLCTTTFARYGPRP